MYTEKAFTRTNTLSLIPNIPAAQAQINFIYDAKVHQMLGVVTGNNQHHFVLSYATATFATLLNGIEIMLIVTKIKRATDFEIVLLNLATADFFNSVLFILVQ